VDEIISTLKNIPAVPPSPPFSVGKYIANSVQLADADRRVVTIHKNHMNHEIFESLWSTANPYPLLITGHKLQLEWTPATFIELIGPKACKVQNCRTGVVYDSTVTEFFSLYGADSDDREVLRLKVISFYRLFV
jgi:hypothetical protein